MGAIHVNEQNFSNEVLKSPDPVLVDFAAEWCGPCKMMAPVIEDLADELNGKLRVVKINVDEAQGLAAKYNVMSIPNFIVFKGGKIIDQMTGAMTKEQLIRKITPYL